MWPPMWGFWGKQRMLRAIRRLGKEGCMSLRSLTAPTPGRTATPALLPGLCLLIDGDSEIMQVGTPLCDSANRASTGPTARKQNSAQDTRKQSPVLAGSALWGTSPKDSSRKYTPRLPQPRCLFTGHLHGLVIFCVPHPHPRHSRIWGTSACRLGPRALGVHEISIAWCHLTPFSLWVES